MATVIEIGKKTVDPAVQIKDQSIENYVNIVVYAKIKNINDLSNATRREHREHFFLPLAKQYDNQEIMIEDIMNKQWNLLVRKNDRDGQGALEVTNTISKEMYVALRNLATVGYKFKHLEFPIPHTSEFWEAMVFMCADGQDHPWIKLSYSSSKDLNGRFPQLPFMVEDFIIQGDPTLTEDRQKIINDLWTKEYSCIDESDIIKR